MNLYWFWLLMALQGGQFPGGFPGGLPGGIPGTFPGGFPGGFPGLGFGFSQAVLVIRRPGNTDLVVLIFDGTAQEFTVSDTIANQLVAFGVPNITIS